MVCVYVFENHKHNEKEIIYSDKKDIVELYSEMAFEKRI